MDNDLIEQLPTSINSIDHLNLMQAYIHARMSSDDLETQNGAVLFHPQVGIVVGSANCYPNNFTPPPIVYTNREIKNKYIVCAERNCIYKAASKGVVCSNLHLYCPFIACNQCVKAIIQSGITKVVGHRNLMTQVGPRWRYRCVFGIQMLIDAGIEVVLWEGKVFPDEDNFTIRFDKKEYRP